jgi:hypothetical protein
MNRYAKGRDRAKFSKMDYDQPIEQKNINRIQYQGQNKSLRQNKEWNGMVAPFVDSQDVLAFQLLYSLNQKKPWRAFAGYALSPVVTSDEIMVWTKDETAVICIAGQNIATNSQHLIDDFSVVGISDKDVCALRLAQIAKDVINKISKNFKEIIVCGYSLGGTIVGCVADLVTRGVIFNGGAPPTNAPRTTPQNCTVYHIVGDILSTHFVSAKRIYLVETQSVVEQSARSIQVDGINWMDVGYYHSLERYLDLSAPYKIVTSQFEQNSIENFFYLASAPAVDLAMGVAGAASSAFNIQRKLQDIVTQNPIPGASVSRTSEQSQPKEVEKIVGKVIGGTVGAVKGFLTQGPSGIISGAAEGAEAGGDVATGKKGILDVINPEIGKNISMAAEKITQGANNLTELNTGSGKFTGTIVSGNDRNVLGTRSGLVVKPFNS